MPEGNASYSEWTVCAGDGKPIVVRSIGIDIGPGDLTFRQLPEYRLEMALTHKAQKRLTNALRTIENRYRRGYRRYRRAMEKARRERLKACANSVNQ